MTPAQPSRNVEGGNLSAAAAVNVMRAIHIAKITLNVGAGKDEELLKKGLKLLERLSPVPPVKTITQKRIPGWGLRPGLAIGGKVTIRKGTEALLRRLLAAKEFTLPESNFDECGNFSFGIPEYVDIEGLEYDPDLKILGLEVAVTIERPGYRIKRRKTRPQAAEKPPRATKKKPKPFVKNRGVNTPG